MKKILEFFKSLLNFNVVIKVNETTYQSGKNLSIRNGRIFVDGKDVTPIAEKFEITVSGDVEKIDFDYVKAINVTGNVGTVNAGMGDVNVSGNIGADAHTGHGDIEVKGDIIGNAKTSMGNVKAVTINGDAESKMGDITAVEIKGNASTKMGDVNKAFKK